MKILIDKGYRNHGVQRGPINEGAVLFQKKVSDDLSFNFHQWNWDKYENHLRKGNTYEFDVYLDSVSVADLSFAFQCSFYAVAEDRLTEEVVEELERNATFLYNVFMKGKFDLELTVMSEEIKGDINDK